ncbi:hypothetical protein [Streptomyces sp. NPDC047974]|uniref:hypothetical protein n=1 Tax=Streptomyces sp. NPDC047974 TaxID=3154343 RepID=UPI0034097775
MEITEQTFCPLFEIPRDGGTRLALLVPEFEILPVLVVSFRPGQELPESSVTMTPGGDLHDVMLLGTPCAGTIYLRDDAMRQQVLADRVVYFGFTTDALPPTLATVREHTEWFDSRPERLLSRVPVVVAR